VLSWQARLPYPPAYLNSISEGVELRLLCVEPPCQHHLHAHRHALEAQGRGEALSCCDVPYEESDL